MNGQSIQNGPIHLNFSESCLPLPPDRLGRGEVDNVASGPIHLERTLPLWISSFKESQDGSLICQLPLGCASATLLNGGERVVVSRRSQNEDRQFTQIWKLDPRD